MASSNVSVKWDASCEWQWEWEKRVITRDTTEWTIKLPLRDANQWTHSPCLSDYTYLVLWEDYSIIIEMSLEWLNHLILRHKESIKDIAIMWMEKAQSMGFSCDTSILSSPWKGYINKCWWSTDYWRIDLLLNRRRIARRTSVVEREI